MGIPIRLRTFFLPTPSSLSDEEVRHAALDQEHAEDDQEEKQCTRDQRRHIERDLVHGSCCVHDGDGEVREEVHGRMARHLKR